MCPQMDVLFDGDDVVVRCEICGRSCVVPRGLPVHQLRDFYDGHPADQEAARHAVDCPWP